MTTKNEIEHSRHETLNMNKGIFNIVQLETPSVKAELKGLLRWTLKIALKNQQSD